MSSSTEKTIASSCPIAYLGKLCYHFKIYVQGFLAILLLSLFSLISLPVYLYRWILTLICPTFGYSHPVTSLGNIFATELLSNRPPRNAIISNFVVEGTVPREEIWQLVKRRWIDASNGGEDNQGSKKQRSSQKKYPELQQYVEYWMGFLFWRTDLAFRLDNHLKFHNIPASDGNDDGNSEKFICKMMEHLLNKQFVSKRSPWEIHVVTNYRNSQLASSNKPLTCVILRFHHSLVDGFSLLYAVIEGLFQQSMESLSFPEPQSSSTISCSSMSSSLFQLPLRLAYDLGKFYENLLQSRHHKNPWIISDRRKKWHQLYARSQLIPVSKIKAIKNHFRVSFTATILSCIASAIKKSLESSHHPPLENVTTLSPLPLANHPKKLVNHVTAAIFQLPTSPSLNSEERLQLCEKRLSLAKRSTIPSFGLLYSHLFGNHFTSVAKQFLTNRLIPCGLSNFAGPTCPIQWNGYQGLAADFVAGAVQGVAGVGFMLLTYHDNLRLAISAEEAVLDQNQAEQLIDFITEEIDNLYVLSTSHAEN